MRICIIGEHTDEEAAVNQQRTIWQSMDDRAGNLGCFLFGTKG